MSDLDRAVDLIRIVYAYEPVGGPLHVELDDGNLDGQLTVPDMVVCPAYDCGWGHSGWPDHDRGVYAWAVVAAIRELVPLLNRMPEADRLEARERALALDEEPGEVVPVDDLEETLDQAGRPRAPWEGTQNASNE